MQGLILLQEKKGGGGGEITFLRTSVNKLYANFGICLREAEEDSEGVSCFCI